MNWKLGIPRSFVFGGAILLLGVALFVGLNGIPLDATVDLRWVHWVTMGFTVATFAAVWALAGIEGFKRNTGMILMCGMGVLMLGSLIPGLGRRAVNVDDALSFGFVVLIFAAIAVENFLDAWKKKDKAK